MRPKFNHDEFLVEVGCCRTQDHQVTLQLRLSRVKTKKIIREWSEERVLLWEGEPWSFNGNDKEGDGIKSHFLTQVEIHKKPN